MTYVENFDSAHGLEKPASASGYGDFVGLSFLIGGNGGRCFIVEHDCGADSSREVAIDEARRIWASFRRNGWIVAAPRCRSRHVDDFSRVSYLR